MSDRVGPMAWSSNNQVFLGEDLMQSRDYSDETARVIDEEVERILREAEDDCRDLLRENREGLELVARALLEHETIPGSEVYRLIRLAGGEPNDQEPIGGTTLDGSDSDEEPDTSERTTVAPDGSSIESPDSD